MTYVVLARQLAIQESNALRGWARAGRTVPSHQPIDRWDEWCRHQHVTAAHQAQRNAA